MVATRPPCYPVLVGSGHVGAVEALLGQIFGGKPSWTSQSDNTCFSIVSIYCSINIEHYVCMHIKTLLFSIFVELLKVLDDSLNSCISLEKATMRNMSG